MTETKGSGTEVGKWEDTYTRLTADFPRGAYAIDDSRGFRLVGVRVAFVIERLTSVFGIAGVGWRYAHSSFEMFDKEVVVEVVLQYRVDNNGTHAYYWDVEKKQFVPDYNSKAVWSEPIQSSGGNKLGSGSVPMSDARKSAVSAALSKAASKIGVGQNAYMGKLVIDGTNVTVRDDDGLDPDDLTRTLNNALSALFVEAPSTYEKLLRVGKSARVWHATMLANFAKKIADANLSEFVTDNLQKIVGREVNRLEDLSSVELIYLNGMIVSISGSHITQEDALVAANSWDKKSAWSLDFAPEVNVVEDDGDDSE